MSTSRKSRNVQNQPKTITKERPQCRKSATQHRIHLPLTVVAAAAAKVAPFRFACSFEHLIITFDH